MSKTQPIFKELSGFDDVYTVQSGQLNCTAIRLKSGNLCLYSPVSGLQDDGLASLQNLADVSVLLAPNHYHNKALVEYSKWFPKADLVCSMAASPRLSKIIGLEFADIKMLAAKLPSHIKLIEPEGLKTGEVWFQIEYGKDVIWVVTDAFSGPSKLKGEYGSEPQMLGTFPKFGVSDAAVYKSWLKTQLSRQAPTVLIPCHGRAVKSANLGAAMIKLLDQKL